MNKITNPYKAIMFTWLIIIASIIYWTVGFVLPIYGLCCVENIKSEILWVDGHGNCRNWCMDCDISKIM